ncbi:synaptobrevin homolog YKT6-like [Uloborus diversus]|uniref:synaptobrevin homolog YKT6-like n=1 Tax=Uloborus diversus TaxID=327109 RepID=UPI002409B069|nr:synaptobrevin homolog YKT6-like [Uloborus diversus]XP_054719932.1 synaptobrevin homolog YKT6-like [Uloborus diversus]XP_054719933.1 synaptobrevin homolog YKT6-like [Uloborus diversus]
MVKLYHLAVLYKHPSKAVTLCSTSDLTSFGFFQRNSVSEFMTFTSQILAERTQPSSRTSVKEQAYMCHVYVRADRLCGALISDHEYPHRVAHTLLNKLLEDFCVKVPPAAWAGDPGSVVLPGIEKYLSDYQDPRNADALTKIQDELDETKIILHNTLEAVLQRGEKIDDLVVKSEQLSMQSKAFYKTARKTNSCCVVL